MMEKGEIYLLFGPWQCFIFDVDVFEILQSLLCSKKALKQNYAIKKIEKKNKVVMCNFKIRLSF